MSSALMPVGEALQKLLEQAVVLAESEQQPIDSALGRVLANAQSADLDVPSYDNSAMDGYALRAADVSDIGVTLRQSQTIAAGHPGTTLEPGTIARIFTGAPVPAGADTVVMQENTEATDQGVKILEMPRLGQNIRSRGHDIAAGSTVLEQGHLLQPQDLGLLASLGSSEISVYRPLTVAIINTGDEVISPGQPLKPGQLYDSNSFTLSGLLTRLGMNVIKMGIVEDSLEATELALQQAAQQADCLISTGGVSVGDEDHVRQAVINLGSLDLWKLAIKPGKPFSYGAVQGKPFFGLPGNPVAVFVTFVTLVRPVLLRMQGASAIHTPVIPARLGFPVSKAGSRQEYLRVRLERNDKGESVVQKFPDQGSSIMTSLSWADGLAVIPQDLTLQAGDTVDFLPFKGLY